MDAEITNQLKSHYNNILEILTNTVEVQVQEQTAESFNELATSIRFLRNSCSQGVEIQCYIINLPEIFNIVELVWSCNNCIKNFNDEQFEDTQKLLWQLLVNLTVNNANTQEIVWEKYFLEIKKSLENELTNFTDIQLMILYNIWKTSIQLINKDEILITFLKIWSNILQKQDPTIKVDFLYIFFEDILCNQKRNFKLIKMYDKLKSEFKILLLKYIGAYLRQQNPNGYINKLLMENISKQFKIKSDYIIKYINNPTEIDNIYPEEVLELLDVISIGTGDEIYTNVYAQDHSLFLNVGSLLQILNEMGQRGKNILTPMEKLSEVAPCSKIPTDFEHEISFELRTKLIRTLANLLYKNDKNKQYAREMNFITTILNCTRVDARNPLAKEWSILAIRNLCENCIENKETISKLSKTGDAPNKLLKELNLELGALRIKPTE